VITVLQGDCREVMRGMHAGSVHCVVTSPPYWMLRSYLGNGDPLKEYEIGSEPTPDLYVQHIVEVFREVWRVLRDDGTAWLNVGDSYAGSWGNYAPGGIKGTQRERHDGGERWDRPAYSDTSFCPPPSTPRAYGLKPKDLCLIPARVALALQADGWYLRSQIVWAKGVSFCPTYSGSCMPESVQDRPTNSYEMVYLLSKSARYFYDAEAVRETQSTTSHGGDGANAGDKRRLLQGDNGTLGQTPHQVGSSGRNLRSVWLINPEPLRQAHYAAFPRALIRPMILAGTSERGVCAECGSPWERVTEREVTRQGNTYCSLQETEQPPGIRHGKGASTMRSDISTTSLSWRPTCTCDAGEPVPATVLDMFGGAGTTGIVAHELGRDAVIIDLNGEYCQMSVDRANGTTPVEVEVDGETIEVQQASLFPVAEVVT